MYAYVVADTDYGRRAAIALRAARYELAERIGVVEETVARWERADVRLPAEQAALVTVALDLPGDLLMRPPTTRERALAMVAAWDVLREAEPRH
jgi:transcriptional regulator with XRE-family HTH domain